MVSSRRTRFEIIADILRLGKTTRTRIMYSSNLSFRLLEKYVTWLCDRGYLTITHEDNKTFYCTTEEGRKLVERIDQVTEMLAEPKTAGELPVVQSKIGRGA